jgi:hypothetical protein
MKKITLIVLGAMALATSVIASPPPHEYTFPDVSELKAHSPAGFELKISVLDLSVIPVEQTIVEMPGLVLAPIPVAEAFTPFYLREVEGICNPQFLVHYQDPRLQPWQSCSLPYSEEVIGARPLPPTLRPF